MQRVKTPTPVQKKQSVSTPQKVQVEKRPISPYKHTQTSVKKPALPKTTAFEPILMQDFRPVLEKTISELQEQIQDDETITPGKYFFRI